MAGQLQQGCVARGGKNYFSRLENFQQYDMTQPQGTGLGNLLKHGC